MGWHFRGWRFRGWRFIAPQRSLSLFLGVLELEPDAVPVRPALRHLPGALADVFHVVEEESLVRRGSPLGLRESRVQLRRSFLGRRLESRDFGVLLLHHLVPLARLLRDLVRGHLHEPLAPSLERLRRLRLAISAPRLRLLGAPLRVRRLGLGGLEQPIVLFEVHVLRLTVASRGLCHQLPTPPCVRAWSVGVKNCDAPGRRHHRVLISTEPPQTSATGWRRGTFARSGSQTPTMRRMIRVPRLSGSAWRTPRC